MKRQYPWGIKAPIACASFALTMSALVTWAAPETGPKWIAPRIAEAGRVVQLPRASMQPQPDSKVIFDVTKHDDPKQPAKGLEKVARWVNLNAAADVPPSRLRVAVVLHGDAARVVLADAAYKHAAGVATNPNAKLLDALLDAGVEVYVCGQALAHQGLPMDALLPRVRLATAAYAVLAQTQARGYAYLPE